MAVPPGRVAPSPRSHLPQLDALRGIAILSVFAQHTGDRFLPLVRGAVETSAPPALAPWIMTTLHHAWWGVDLFFVLSGFSLALSWLRSGGQTLGAFFRRRAARILPAYVVALAVTIAFHRAVVEAPGFAASLLAHSLVLQGYWSPGGIVIIGATWSLTTEISFYLVFPWLARLFSRGRRGLFALAAVVLGGWIARFALFSIFVEPGVYAGLFEATQRRWIPSRIDQFVLGMLAARAFVALESFPRAEKIAPFALLASAPLLIVAFRLEGLFFLERAGIFAYAFLSLVTAAVVLASSLCTGRALAFVAPRPLAFVGVASYGVFLYHQLALGLCDLDRASPPSWPNLARTATLALALSVLVGQTSWVAIERPIMRLVARNRAAAKPALRA